MSAIRRPLQIAWLAWEMRALLFTEVYFRELGLFEI